MNEGLKEGLTRMMYVFIVALVYHILIVFWPRWGTKTRKHLLQLVEAGFNVSLPRSDTAAFWPQCHQYGAFLCFGIGLLKMFPESLIERLVLKSTIITFSRLLYFGPFWEHISISAGLLLKPALIMQNFSPTFESISCPVCYYARTGSH